MEPIYKNLKLSAPFNEQLADVLCVYVRHRLPSLAPHEKVRLIRRLPAWLAAMAGIHSWWALLSCMLQAKVIHCEMLSA